MLPVQFVVASLLGWLQRGQSVVACSRNMWSITITSGIIKVAVPTPGEAAGKRTSGLETPRFALTKRKSYKMSYMRKATISMMGCCPFLALSLLFASTTPQPPAAAFDAAPDPEGARRRTSIASSRRKEFHPASREIKQERRPA